MLVRLQEPSTSSTIQETDGMTHCDASTQGKYTFMEHHIYAFSDSFHCPLLHDQATQCPEQHLVHTKLLWNDRLCLLYTGLSVDAFEALSDNLKEGCSISQLHPKVTLMELWLNLLQDDIAKRFRVSQSVVSRIISEWLDFMEEKMRCYVPWLPRETIQATMPRSFKGHIH